MRTPALLLVLWAAATANAAATAETVTPANTSVESTQSQVLSARFRDAAGNPSVGEAVLFSSDSCGTFSNGQFQMTVMTGAGGIASVTFTAPAESGLACPVRATAGAQVVFSIRTYRLDRVSIHFDVLANPYPPRPGQPFTVEAYVKLDTVELANVDFTVQVVPGTGTGSISSTAGNTGTLTRLQVNVFPDDSVGHFEVLFDFRGVKRRFQVNAGALVGTYQDMWWEGPAGNGWGMSVVQHDNRLFVVLYVYDINGRPTWYVMSGGTWNSAGTAYTGPLYSPRGSPFFAYDVARFDVGAAVGEVTITFNDAANAILDFTIGTRSGTKGISRQPFGPIVQNPLLNRGDMFWGGTAQNGWGVAALQQYNQLFIVWFTYDAAGLPTWFVMPAGSWTNPTTYEGRLYRTTSSAWLESAYRPEQLVVIDVGPFRLRFTNDSPSALDWTVDARSGTLTLMRQGF